MERFNTTVRNSVYFDSTALRFSDIASVATTTILKAYFFALSQPLEFRKFVENAERQLFGLFKSIDKDGNGKLDKNELQTAFKHAGLTLSNRRLSEFFDDMDINNDGYVTFDEWRSVSSLQLSQSAFPLLFSQDFLTDVSRASRQMFIAHD